MSVFVHIICLTLSAQWLSSNPFFLKCIIRCLLFSLNNGCWKHQLFRTNEKCWYEKATFYWKTFVAEIKRSISFYCTNWSTISYALMYPSQLNGKISYSKIRLIWNLSWGPCQCLRLHLSKLPESIVGNFGREKKTTPVRNICNYIHFVVL